MYEEYKLVGKGFRGVVKHDAQRSRFCAVGEMTNCSPGYLVKADIDHVHLHSSFHIVVMTILY
jgi:hypothetical protein